MEGHRCEEPGCSLHDFLPFHCARCERYYCLEHRSRFVHSCQSMEDEGEHNSHHGKPSSGDPSNVPAMMQAVENRHKELDKALSSSASTHHRVKPQDSGLPTHSSSFTHSMQRLDHIQHSSHTNDRERRVGEQTRRMMMKQKAVGNEQLLPELRLYLTLHFEDMPTSSSTSTSSHKPTKDSQEVVYFYCSKSALLGEVLQQIKTRFGQYCVVAPEFRQAFNPPTASSTFSNQYSLAVSTMDANNWRDWNRTAPVKELLQSFEDVWISLVPTTHAVEAQDHLKATLQHQKHAQQQQQQESKQEEKKVTRVSHNFAKGDFAWYFKTPPPTSDDEDYQPLHLYSLEEAQQANVPVILVKVIGVHHDDFPNIYYTIGLVQPVQGHGSNVDRLVFHTEKQTDAGHLLVYHAPSAEEQTRHAVEELERHIQSLGDVFTIRASYNKEEYVNIRISSKSTIAQLRLLLSIYSKVPVPSLKMIYKGVVLKQDTHTVGAAKIAPNSKIVIMG